jgi:hypothetical protein
MDTTEKEKFESLWTNFLVLVKGKLINAANKQTLSPSLASLILADAAGSWASEYELNGRWLKKLNETDPQKGTLVSEVLLNDMKFTAVETKGELPLYYNYAIPVAGGLAGWGVSMLCGAGKLVQAASAVLPALLLYPAVNTLRKNLNSANHEKAIADYVGQLEKYKNSVLSILS